MSGQRYKLETSFMVPAVLLHGEYIGRVIRFPWHFPHSHVYAEVTGELRQLDHVESEVRINLVGHEAEGGDLTEFVLSSTTDVTFMDLVRE